MIYYLLFVILFVNVVMSLRCKTARPPNCIYNSTCIHNITECKSTSHIRGGTYCTTLITKKFDDILVGSMDCMYDQETAKKCKNQSECSMKYTNHEKKFLHCCCDQDFCNLNFILSNPDPPLIINPDPCKDLFCKRISIIILLVVIGLLILSIIICFIYRNKLLKCFEKCGRFIDKNPSPKLDEKYLVDRLLTNENKQEIYFNHLFIGNIVKTGRFSTIHQGTYENQKIAIKILFTQNQNDEPQILFQHEKQIYSQPFMTHFNILKYYGYSESNGKLCIITDLSDYGSLRDVLRSRLLKDDKELILILKQICEGLQYLHSDFQNKNGLNRPPIAHRDLKSENILYLNDNQLVICDFAMSTIIQQNENGPNQQQQIGTPRYMSPEILAGTIGCEKDALLKCDVYALGIIFWEVLSRYPFKSNQNYIQPFEKQLNELNLNVNNPSINDMLKIMYLPNQFDHRPLMSPLWNNSNIKWLNSIVSTMEDCWDQSPESRIPSGLALKRIQQINI